MAKTFSYRGRDSAGNIITGNLTVNTIDEVIVYLEVRSIVITDIRIINTNSANFSQAIIKLIAKFSSQPVFTQKIADYDIMNFCRQLATLNKAGISLVQAIEQLAKSAKSTIFKQILLALANDVSAGLTLEQALKKSPSVFSPVVTSVVGVGESTGYLTESLLQLSIYLESEIANKRSLASATRYPIFVICSILVAIIFMSIFVIPKFTAMFTHLDIKLPLPTIITMAISNFIIHHQILLATTAIGIWLAINQLLKIKTIRYSWDKKKLSIPIIGNIQKRIMISQFAWTFCLVLRSGLPITQGISLVANTTGNTYFSTQLLTIIDALKHGEVFSLAAEKSGLFTPIVMQMIKIGEESGQLSELILQIAKSYDAEIKYDMRRLSELLEPFMLIVVGGMVLVLALSIYLPMWNMINALKQN